MNQHVTVEDNIKSHHEGTNPANTPDAKKIRMSEELSFIPATELTRMIREKTVSPVEIMRQAIARAEALNPRLNAICTPTFDAAMQAAAEAEDAVMRGRPLGILHGVPTTIKDLAFTKGVRSMAGSHIHRNRIPGLDHLHVERMQAAGAISIGKTTVSEFGPSVRVL